MTRAGAAGARFRQRKLSTKQTLQILREDQVERVDDDPQRNIPKVETGVEKGEEVEHHLQAAISASQAAAIGGKVAQISIPTPITNQSSLQYDKLYALRFSQPATYIRFSSTVEDSVGCQYCMNNEDDVFMKTLKPKQSTKSNELIRCSEDQFEEIMYFFEDTAHSKQPYAAVDSPPVLSFEDMVDFDDTLDDDARLFAEDIYSHWRAQRLKKGNRSLITSLKVNQFETGQETDDGDPYVCFRRREVRQVRKTRGRDAHSIDKLRALRNQLEDARQLVQMVKQREILKKDSLAVDRRLFELRFRFKQARKSIGKNDNLDDELLINQKPQKKRGPESPQSARGPGGQLGRMAMRPDGRAAELELIQLKDVLEEKARERELEIRHKVEQHKKWNTGVLDCTLTPFTPDPEEHSNADFHPAVFEYMPTPPSSASSDIAGYNEDNAVAFERNNRPRLERKASPSFEESTAKHSRISFRQRIGRGGRRWMDRRFRPVTPEPDLDPRILDRFKFDKDDDDDLPVYHRDIWSTDQIGFRAQVMTSPRDQQAHASYQQAQLVARKLQQDVATNSSQGMAGPSSSPPRPGLSLGQPQ